MKILHVVKTSEGANWAFEQAKWLQEQGVEVVTILPDDKGVIAKKYKENKMKICLQDVSLPITKPWQFFNRKKKIQKIVKEEKPDIIHTHFVTNIIMLRLALKKSRIPRLFQVPGPLHLESRIFRKLDIITSNELDYWAPSCQKSKEIYLQEKVPENRLFLAYYGGYGGDKINQYTNSKNLLHQQYNIPDDNILIGMVSYFYKPKWYLGQKRGIKGHEDFIDAIAILNKDYPNITAIIIGGAWGNSQKYEQKVKQYADKNNIKNIIFTGFRTDIKEIYKEISIAVHPSHSENLGGAAESLAAGVPTIATNVGGFPDIVINGKTGYLAQAKNPKALSQKIKIMIENKQEAETLAKEGQKKVKELLDINYTAKEMLKIYQKIMEN